MDYYLKSKDVKTHYNSWVGVVLGRFHSAPRRTDLGAAWHRENGSSKCRKCNRTDHYCSKARIAFVHKKAGHTSVLAIITICTPSLHTNRWLFFTFTTLMTVWERWQFFKDSMLAQSTDRQRLTRRTITRQTTPLITADTNLKWLFLGWKMPLSAIQRTMNFISVSVRWRMAPVYLQNVVVFIQNSAWMILSKSDAYWHLST